MLQIVLKKWMMTGVFCGHSHQLEIPLEFLVVLTLLVQLIKFLFNGSHFPVYQVMLLDCVRQTRHGLSLMSPTVRVVCLLTSWKG